MIWWMIFGEKYIRKRFNWAMFFTGIVGPFWVVYKAKAGSFPIDQRLTETYEYVIAATFFTVILSLFFPDKTKQFRFELYNTILN